MAEYYRTIFTISSEKGQGLELLNEVELCVRQCAAEEFGDSYQMNEERGEWEGREGTLRPNDRKLNESGFSSLVWERRESDGLDSLWRLSLRLATDGNDVESDIEVQGVESDGKAVPWEYMARPPAFLKTLVERFDCNVDGRPLKTTAIHVPLAKASAFAKDELLNADRRMPLVVVSGKDAKTYSKEADRLQSQLIGLARVFNYDHNTAWNIAKDLPRSLRCYDGAVRLYSPGCSEGDISQQHPYWMRDDVDKLAGRFWPMLRDECVNRVSRRGRRRLFAQVRELIREEDTRVREEDTRALELKVEQLEQSGSENEESLVDESLVDELMQMLTQSDSDVPSDDRGTVSIRKYNTVKRVASAFWNGAKESKNRADRLEEDKKQLKQQLALLEGGALPVAYSEELEGDSSVDTPATDGFVSVLEAVQHADKALNGLRFLPNAFDTAKSEYTREFDGQASKMYDALLILNECAEKRPKGLGMGLDVWFRRKYVDFSDESKPTREKFSKERTFYDDKSECYVTMMRHIKILNNDIRIHVRWERDEGKWLVGYIGRHLRTVTDPS